jgi:hypothetical protein
MACRVFVPAPLWCVSVVAVALVPLLLSLIMMIGRVGMPVDMPSASYSPRVFLPFTT